MRRLALALSLSGLLLCGRAFAQDKKTETFFTFPKTVQLTDEQKAKLETLKKELGPKLNEANARVNAVMTPERQKAAAEALKKAMAEGKKGKDAQEAVNAALNLPREDQARFKEANLARSKLMQEINQLKIDLLTAEQRAQLKPKK